MSEKKQNPTNLSQPGPSVKAGEGRMQKSQLLERANTLPQGPGCYLMLNSRGEIIYVGKAKNLKSRVTSYFNKSVKTPKTQILVGHIVDFDFILTNSDAESFVLENNLIKKHYPKYNIRLKDDKSYPYVAVDTNEEYPRLNYVRRPKRKRGVQLFGPYPTGSNISSTMKILTKAFCLRDCTIGEFNKRKTPCMLYQMRQCSAPCVSYISKDEYQANLDWALNFLKGGKNAAKTVAHLKEKMLQYAEAENFEQAAMLRDYIGELELFLEKSFDQSVELNQDFNMDVIAHYQGEEQIDISIYILRSGNLLGHKNFHFLLADIMDDPQEEVMQFMLQYYSNTDEVIPDKIVMDLDEHNIDIFQEALKQQNEMYGIKFEVTGAGRKYKSLIDSVKQHAYQSQRVRQENQQSVYTGLHKLKELLKLSSRPTVLECYDIAVWQGSSPTASQIVFHDGKPDRKQYRYYHLQQRPEGNNDFAMMAEVFTRRLKHGNLPDVFVVDGGVAQVNTVTAVLKELNVDIPVVGIAKSRYLTSNEKRSMNKSEERLIIPGRANPYILSKCPPLFRVIVQMRDEAHRFSRKLHHKAEKSRIFASWLDEIPGVGPKTRQKIQKKLELTKEQLSKHSKEEIAELLEIDLNTADKIYSYLNN